MDAMTTTTLSASQAVTSLDNSTVLRVDQDGSVYVGTAGLRREYQDAAHGFDHDDEPYSLFVSRPGGEIRSAEVRLLSQTPFDSDDYASASYGVFLSPAFPGDPTEPVTTFTVHVDGRV